MAADIQSFAHSIIHSLYLKFLSLTLAVVLLAAGLTKLFALPFQRRHFRHWNLPGWFLRLTGLLELIAAGGLLLPGFTYFGAAVGAFVLLGAVVTCWIVYEYLRSLLPLALLIATGVLLWQLQPGSTLTYTLFGIAAVGLLVSGVSWCYPSTPPNRDGDVETLADGTAVTHHFREVLGVRYHYVTAGPPGGVPFVIVPGAPESWFCFHHQIADLSQDYRLVVIDLKPYGQTGKDPDGDHSYAHIATEIGTLLDEIGIEKFFLGGHDRGTVATDHLLNLPGMPERVLGYVRMQQSFNEPHGKPVPPHHLMQSFWGTMAFKLRFAMWLVYVKSFYTKLPIDRRTVRRIRREFQFRGIATNVPRSFKTTSFARERADRFDFLFDRMTMPVLILQGRYDPGQHPEEYAQSHTVVPNLRVQFIKAGHFFHLEAPEATNGAMRGFLAACSEERRVRK